MNLSEHEAANDRVEQTGTVPATAQKSEQPRAAQTEQELLCTICNLRACWEAPDAPAVTP